MLARPAIEVSLGSWPSQRARVISAFTIVLRSEWLTRAAHGNPGRNRITANNDRQINKTGKRFERSLIGVFYSI
jgi:hypothetical protein